MSRACASMAKSDRPIAHMGAPEALSGPLLSASHGRPKRHATPAASSFGGAYRALSCLPHHRPEANLSIQLDRHLLVLRVTVFLESMLPNRDMEYCMALHRIASHFIFLHHFEHFEDIV